MSASGFSSAFTVRAGPNATGRLVDGSSDGLYWVRGQVNGGNEWRGPFATSGGADLAARALLDLLYSPGLAFNSLCWVEWGKRYWKANDGAYNGGKWLLMADQGYASVQDLPALGDDPPPDTSDLFHPPVAYVTYSAISVDTGAYVGSEHTEFDGPLGGVNSIVQQHIWQDVRSDIGISLVKTSIPTNELLAFFSIPPATIPNGVTALGVEVEVAQYGNNGRLVWRPNAYTGVSYKDYHVGGNYPIGDPRAKVTFLDPSTSLPIDLAFVNKPTRIAVIDALYPDPLLVPAGMTAVDNTFSWYDVFLRYRVHYSDGVNSQWVQDQVVTRVCRYLNGPYNLWIDNRTSAIDRSHYDYSSDAIVQNPGSPVLFWWYACWQGNNDPAKDPNFLVRYTGPMVFKFPVPPGADGFAALVYEVYGARVFQRRSLLGPGQSYKIVAGGSDGTVSIPYYPLPENYFNLARTQANPDHALAISFVTLWGDKTKYPNGSTFQGWDHTPSWRYKRSTGPFNPASVSRYPLLAGSSGGPDQLCLNTGPYDDFGPLPQNDPTDHIITTHSVLALNNHFCPLWIAADDDPVPAIDTSGTYVVGMANGKRAYWRLGDQRGGPVVAGKGIVGYNKFLTTSTGIQYLDPVYISGPRLYATDVDKDISADGTTPLPVLHNVDLYQVNSAIGAFDLSGMGTNGSTLYVRLFGTTQFYLTTVTD